MLLHDDMNDGTQHVGGDDGSHTDAPADAPAAPADGGMAGGMSGDDHGSM